MSLETAKIRILIPFVMFSLFFVGISESTNTLRSDVRAASCTWVGGSGAWETGSNWSTGVSPTQTDDVIIDASVTVTINGPTTVKSVTLGNISSTTSPVLIFGYDGSTQGPLTTSGGNFIVYQNATVTHAAAVNDVIIGRVNISALSGNVEIYGSVNVDAKGYSGGTTVHYYGWGPGGGSGQSHSYQDRPGAGGGHGGWGGNGWSSGGAPYETHLLPLDVGSGGGRGERYGGTSSNGGAGGGAVKITASGSITVNGSITSAGGSGGTKGGGGSGGSIHLVTSTFTGTGTGTISALGGNGGSGNGGLGGNGGGGRILIEFTLSDSYTGTNSVNQGLNGNSGEHGSSLLLNSTTDDLWIKTSQTWNTKPSLDGTHHTFKNAYIEDSATLTVRPYIDTDTHDGADNSNVLTSTISSWENDYWAGTVIYNETDKSKGTVISNTATTITATLSGGTDNDWDVGDIYVLGMGITFSVSNFVLETGSVINASGQGYAGGTAAHYYGWGPGGGPGQTDSYSDRPGAGGGYGGKGGNGYSTGGSPYGSQFDPIDLGSGGGHGERYTGTSANGGAGGGSVHIVASDTATIDGTIDVSGDISGGYKGGGGSGGSIKIQARQILGTGVMTANGGNVSTIGDSGIIGGTGGGGRITLLFSDTNLFTGTTFVDPGTGGTLGDPGTIELVGIPSGSSLAQYKSDGSTLIPTGNPTDETTVVLKMTMSDTDATDTLTPEFEVREVGTDFTGTTTHTGSGIAYSGTPVEGSATVSGLSDSLHYHWQARVCDSISICSAWISYGGNLETEDDFYISLVPSYIPTASASNVSGELDIYAGKTFDIITVYGDENGSLNISEMYLRIDHPTETDIEYYASGGTDASGLTPTAISGTDRVSAITYDRDADNPTVNDVTITWHIDIDWQWAESSLIEYGVRAVDDEANDSGWDLTNGDYLYENDLTLTGTLTATGAVNGPLSSGDWVQTEELITWDGITAVYEGTTDVYPDDDDFDVRVADDDGGIWDDLASSGNPISIVSTTDAVTDLEDIHSVHFVNLPTGAGDASTESFTIRVDDTTPDIVAITGANNGVWQSSDGGPILSWTDPNSPSSDTFYLTNDGSDPTSSNFMYSTTDPTYDLPNQGEGTTMIKVRAVNGASTAGPIYSFSVMYDATIPAIDTLTSSSHPSEVTWYNDNTPTVEWTTSDGMSGMEGTWRLLDQTATHDAAYVITNGTADIEDGNWTSGMVTDGTWYFYLAVRDNAGLISYGTQTILVDTGVPTIDTLASSSHPNESNWYADNTPSFEWTTSDGAGGVEGTWRLLDQIEIHDTAYIITNGIADIEDGNWTSTAVANGIWYFHLAVRDNTGLTDNGSYTIWIDSTTPDIVDITGANNGVWQNTDPGPILSWTDPSSPSDDTFYLTNDGTDPTSSNFTFSTTDPTYNLPDQGEGETEIRVRAMNGAGTYSTTLSFLVRYDSVPPANVSGLTITTLSTSSLQLNWTNPADADFDHVVVVRKAGSYPTNPGDGTLVYTGSAETYRDNGLSASTQYYYAVFSFDTLGNQSSGAVAFGTTLTPVIPEEPVTPTTQITPTIPADTQDPVIPDDDHDEERDDILEDIDDVEVVEIEEGPTIIILVDGKEIDLGSGSTGFHVYTDSQVEVRVPQELLIKDGTEIRETLVMVGGDVYLLTKNEINTEIFHTAVFDIEGPARELEMDIVVTYEDSTAKTIPLTMAIDPYGYVYTIVGGNQTRIKGAEVTLITRTHAGKEIWKSDNSDYPNPQQTDAEGEYAFFVETGEYQVQVNAEGYNPAHTEWFTVEDGPVNKNVELKKKMSVALITALAVGGATVVWGGVMAVKKVKGHRKGTRT